MFGSMSIIFRGRYGLSCSRKCQVLHKFICWVYNFRNLSCFMIRSLGGRRELREKIWLQMDKLYRTRTIRMGRQMEVSLWRTLLIWLSTNSIETRYCVFIILIDETYHFTGTWCNFLGIFLCYRIVGTRFSLMESHL